MRNNNTFNHVDIEIDPWNVLYMKVPRKAERSLLYKSYLAAQWCRGNILASLRPGVMERIGTRTLMEHSDMALRRMREINTLLRQAA